MNEELGKLQNIPPPGAQEMLWRVEGPGFVGALISINGRIDRGAPIFKYAIGWQVGKFRNMAHYKGWNVILVKACTPGSVEAAV